MEAIPGNPACQESTLTTSLDRTDALFAQKKDALVKLLLSKISMRKESFVY